MDAVSCNLNEFTTKIHTGIPPKPGSHDAETTCFRLNGSTSTKSSSYYTDHMMSVDDGSNLIYHLPHTPTKAMGYGCGGLPDLGMWSRDR